MTSGLGSLFTLTVFLGTSVSSLYLACSVTTFALFDGTLAAWLLLSALRFGLSLGPLLLGLALGPLLLAFALALGPLLLAFAGLLLAFALALGPSPFLCHCCRHFAAVFTFVFSTFDHATRTDITRWALFVGGVYCAFTAFGLGLPLGLLLAF